MPKAPRFFVETATLVLPQRAAREYKESTRTLPTVLYPQIRVLTADKATQNKTFYPLESLIGNESDGTGLISFIRPYPVPIIRDHLTAPGMFGGYASDVYGRVLDMPDIGDEEGVQYIRAVPAITHPEAIESIMDGRWMTVSLGSRVSSVHCSICGADLTDEEAANGCTHEKGDLYDTPMGKQEALWRIGPIRAKEISFVLTPSDDEARVLGPPGAHSGSDNDESAGRLLVGNEAGIFDLQSGRPVAPLPARTHRPFQGFRLPGLVGQRAEAAAYCWTGLLLPSVTESEPAGPLTLGILYLLAATDEEAGTEAPLTTKQRDQLPDAIFCGPHRSFPAANKEHVTAGLRLLERANLSADQKDRVRACLIRKGKRMGMTFDNEAAHAARLVDEAHGVQIYLYPLPTDAAELGAVTAQVAAMPHTQDERVQILGRIAKAAEGWMEPADWQAAYGTQTGVAAGEPVVIAVGSENYALLYAAAELEGEAKASPVPAPASEPPAPNPEPALVTETAGALPEEAAPAGELPATEAAAAAPDPVLDPVLDPVPTPETGCPPPDGRIAETETLPVTEADGTPLTEAPVNPEAPKTVPLELIAREALSHTVALYMRSLRKVAARGKTQAALVQQLSVRTIESLTDTMHDLALEWDSSETAEIARLPHLTDPTAPEAPADPRGAVDPAAPAESAAPVPTGPKLSGIDELPLEEGEPETILVKTSNFLLELFPNLSA